MMSLRNRSYACLRWAGGALVGVVLLGGCHGGTTQGGGTDKGQASRPAAQPTAAQPVPTPPTADQISPSSPQAVLDGTSTTQTKAQQNLQSPKVPQPTMPNQH